MDEDSAANDAKNVRVTAEDGSALPFTMHGRTLEFFAGSPGSVRITAGDHEYLYSLTLPQLGDVKWEPPAEARQGIPHFAGVLDSAKDLWPWLALLGAAALMAEWLMYGRFRRGGREAGLPRPVLLRRKARRPSEARR